MFGGYEFGRPAFGDFLAGGVIPPGPDWITIGSVTSTWPRVVSLDLEAPAVTVVAGWPRVIEVRMDDEG